MKRKKVLHVIDHLGLGGAQTIVRDLVEKNQEHGVLALRGADNMVKFSSYGKERVRVMQGRTRYDLSGIFALKEEIKKRGYEVLHVHLFRAIFIVYLYKLFFDDSDIKVVINEHGAVFSKKRWFYRFLLRRVDRYALCFIAVSKKTKEALVEIAGLEEDRVDVIYNFIDFGDAGHISDKKRREIRAREGLGENDFVVGFVGRMSKVKSLDTLIDAYPHMKNENLKVLIIGDGEMREQLEERASREDGIKFLGYRSDIRELYQILDVIVLPSYSEASPMAFYESQVYGIPFVGSDVYAINEFIKDKRNGLLFEFGDSKGLAKRVMRLYLDKKLREKIREEALKGLEKFDIVHYNKLMDEVYSR